MTDPNPRSATVALPAGDLEAAVEVLARSLGIDIETAWLAGVAHQLGLSLQLARMLEKVPVADTTEPAAVYRL